MGTGDVSQIELLEGMASGPVEACQACRACTDAFNLNSPRLHAGATPVARIVEAYEESGGRARAGERQRAAALNLSLQFADAVPRTHRRWQRVGALGGGIACGAGADHGRASSVLDEGLVRRGRGSP